MQALNTVFTWLIELLRALRAFESPSDQTAGTGLDRATLPVSPSFEDLIAARVTKLENTPLIAGSLELVGLGDMRDRIEQIESAAGGIPAIVEHEIRAAMDQDDFFRRVDDITYVICFATDDRAAADCRAKALSESIRSRVAVEFPALRGTLSVEATTSSVDAQDLMQGGSLTENLLDVLRHVREDMRETARRQRSSLMRQFRVHFLPVVSPAKRQFTLNHCLLDSDAGELSQFKALADPRDLDTTLAELDLCLLTRAIEALHSALKKGPCAPVLVPVNFKTLTTRACALKYGMLAAAVPEKYRALLTLELIGLSRDGMSVIASKAALLSEIPIGRLAIQVPLDYQANEILSVQGLWAVSVSLSGRTSTEPHLASLLGAFVNNASRLGLLTIAHQANSLGLAKLAAETHFNFIDGLAISLHSASPKAPSPAPATLFGLSKVPMRR